MRGLHVCIFVILTASSYSSPVDRHVNDEPNWQEWAYIGPVVVSRDGVPHITQPHQLSPTPLEPTVLNDPTKGGGRPGEPWVKQNNAAATSAIRGVFQNLFSQFAGTFQEIINREQAFLNMINCQNCGANPWQNFLTAMSNIPTLGWVMRPPNNQVGFEPTMDIAWYGIVQTGNRRVKNLWERS